MARSHAGDDDDDDAATKKTHTSIRSSQPTQLIRQSWSPLSTVTNITNHHRPPELLLSTFFPRRRCCCVFLHEPLQESDLQPARTTHSRAAALLGVPMNHQGSRHDCGDAKVRGLPSSVANIVLSVSRLSHLYHLPGWIMLDHSFFVKVWCVRVVRPLGCYCSSCCRGTHVRRPVGWSGPLWTRSRPKLSHDVAE